MTSGIIEILIEDAGVLALAGIQQAGKTKVFPTVIPQKYEQPYIIVSLSALDPVGSLPKDERSLLDYPQFDILCYSESFRQSELMAEAVYAAINNKSAQTDAGYNFKRIWEVNERDGFDNNAQLYARVSTYKAELKR